MDTNEPSVEQPGSCCDSSSAGADSRPPDSGGAGAGPKSWKTAVFVVAIVLAGAVAAHSLLTKNGRTSGIPPCAGGLGTPCRARSLDQCDPVSQTCPKKAACPLEQACPENEGCPSAQGCCPQQARCPLNDQQDQPPPCCPLTAPPGCCPRTGS